MFRQKCSMAVGDGMNIRFWHDVWRGERPLKVVFPNLFSISTKMEGSVAEFWEESQDNAGWNLTFRRLINDWEIDSVGELLGLIQETRPDPGSAEVGLGNQII
ncbi:hypothetical protein BVC80_8695g7 [Macleaya cordata]|uniref:Reverse transcriptase zinc-binding domain n=1 Tax=Macleaya cordata TaxID=56857 RepID=A0A200PPP1_MACCD|nr:hypothetical protein BVC80_8695g7 [Macleaya cordata]